MATEWRLPMLPFHKQWAIGDATKNQVARSSSTNFIFGTPLLNTFYSFFFLFFFFGNRSNIHVDELKKQIENMTSNIKDYMLPTLTNLLRIHVVVSFSTAFNSSTWQNWLKSFFFLLLSEGWSRRLRRMIGMYKLQVVTVYIFQLSK